MANAVIIPPSTFKDHAMNESSTSYLILRPGAIGDAIVALPVIQNLRDHFPAARIELVVGGAVAELLRGRCVADQVSSFDEARWAALFASDASAARELLHEFQHIVFYIADNAQAIRLRAALGDRLTLWPPLPPADAPAPIGQHLQGALAKLGIAPTTAFPAVTLTPEDQEFVRQYWRAHKLEAKPVIALHPGSGSAQKNWPASRYAEVAALLKRDGARLLIIAGPADDAPLKALRERLSGELLTTEGLTLPQVAALLARCRCLVGNDSGIAHLAAAMGVPTLTIFGPTDPVVWAPSGPAVTVLAPRVPCAPCAPEKRRSCVTLECLASISVDLVYQSVCQRLRSAI
jgi:ADP-heptose:LPS heptosyltransferase